MIDIDLLKNKCEAEAVQELLLVNTTGLDFFDLVFKESYSNQLFLESWSVFDEDTYSKFLTLLSSLGENEAYIVSSGYIKYNIDDYIEFAQVETVSNSTHTHGYKIKSTTSFESIEHIQELGNYGILNSYIISESGNWCFYTNPNIDLMVLGFKNEISETVNRVYANFDDRLNSLEALFEFTKNVFSEERIPEFKKQLEQNYNSFY